ncbi:MAG: outer membrane protein assembly factor BamA [Rhodospirillales bacterium]|nr:outer membrane protein assembly factor BamA [Rhodospirillales bacterium]
MNRIKRFLVSTCFVLIAGQIPTLSVAQTAIVSTQLAQSSAVRQILIEGAQRIEPDTVKSYILIREGDNFDASRLDTSLKSLFATGLFADVSIDRRGDILVVKVVENPVINRIAFEGNDKIANDTLELEVTLRPRVIYTRTKVQNDVKRILTLYRRNGRFAASVEPKIIQLPQNRIDLIYEVSEGSLTEVESIRFVGNKTFSDLKLREVIRTKETDWWRFLSNDDTYDPDRITLDRELLRRFYLTDGFADFRVTSALAELTTDRKDFFVTFTVDEGTRYQFNKLEINARLRDLKKEDLVDVIEIEAGEWYDISAVDQIVDNLTNRVGDLGYAFVDVRPRVNRDRENKTIDVTFEVVESPRAFVERIDISGNIRTLDKVIRREFQIIEGDAFNSSKLRRSKNRLESLGFFAKVDMEQRPGSAPDKAVIKVEVEEKSTGSISIGAGFSSSVGPIGDFGITENNFLGRGQNLALNLQLASTRSEIDLAFTEPYFLDREIRAGFDVFHIIQDLQDTSSFDLKRSGFGLRAGYPITEELRQDWKYGFSKTTIGSVDTTATTLIQDDTVINYKSEVSHSVGFDKRDNSYSPTEGYFLNLDTAIAGLGGNVKYARNILRGATYYEFKDQWVLTIGGRFSHIVGLGQDVNILDRFHLGGDNLRGFANSGAGPRDTATDDSLGGEWLYNGSAELAVPLGLPAELGISGRMFTDFGAAGKLSPKNSTTVDDGNLRLSSGIGMTWVSPFGPLGVDYGIPLLKKDYDEIENFRINFGTRF